MNLQSGPTPDVNWTDEKKDELHKALGEMSEEINNNQTFEEWWHEAFIQQNSFNDIRQSAKAAWDHRQKRIDELEWAFKQIVERFESKQSLHKDDCFAYQLAIKALAKEEE